MAASNQLTVPRLNTPLIDPEGGGLATPWVRFFIGLFQASTPIGLIAVFGGTVVPFNWLLCDGSAVSRTIYAGLFGVIGTTFGAGDGLTTFNLPGAGVITTTAPSTLIYSGGTRG